MNVVSSLFVSALLALASHAASAGATRLTIPELIDTKDKSHVELTLKRGAHEFYPGVKSDTLGINGDYLGPTIKLYRGRHVDIRFNNQIGVATTIHGHGLHVPGNVDGGPQETIRSGESRTIGLDITQRASTSWYHPHWMGKTAEHVYAGLAGFYLIEDERSLTLNLPKRYGINDIPLIVQDRSFVAGQMRPYSVGRQQVEDGFRGDTLVVNGTIDAYQNVPQGWVRLRLLNASNARIYRFSLSDSRAFHLIATDGGFVESPVTITQLNMGPGERNEIMVDLSRGGRVTLMAEFLPTDPGDQRLLQQSPRTSKSVLELRADPRLAAQGELPAKLATITAYSREAVVVTRTFRLDMGNRGNGRRGTNGVNGQNGGANANAGSRFNINGHSMDMSMINHSSKLGDIELWRVTGDRMSHPFHIHGVSFQILSRNGSAPAATERGWKDTVMVGERGFVELVMRFDHAASEDYPYMFHCHILEHEDAGMMGQFTVR